jgi:osmotically-inducible protein OsmY
MARTTSTFVTGAATGAALAYLFDPELGRTRRAKLSDMAAARLRRTRERVEREKRYRTGQAEGVLHQATHPAPAREMVEDTTLKARIESEIVTHTAFPGHAVNVTVVDGIVELRGEVQRSEQIDDLRSRVGSVPGVSEVRSFLHLPKTPAPNKAEARTAGSEGRGIPPS